ncbi:VOC family protein [Glaciibacter psychrotolerans]|uniref:Putative enzyme related to lactoylglutathione lyase n=1 Tax=Glaciibacter psychrotolerans TaxID=670054 RepID=A0A7Z0J827_9MICO|nr:VOC family protein [Leifsonia psychrotolerans]NYJ21484.1 putative enzyme related to lactoylglutathione lyase [Leifsonia psychrotolerans]
MASHELGISHGFSGFSVPDIDAARGFYAETLGLAVTDAGMGLLSLELPGGAMVTVYPKPDHQPAVFTIVNLVVDDIDVAVDGLTAKGVEFIHYDGFGQDEKGIARSGGDNPGPSIAWFTDPAGNILSVLHTD